MYLRRVDEEGFFANFEYERLPNFYFICDILGQGECFCRKHLESNGQSLEQRYGLELNADPRRKLRSIGARWLKDEPSPAEEIAAGVSGGYSFGISSSASKNKASSAQSNSNSNGTDGGSTVVDKGNQNPTLNQLNYNVGLGNGKAQVVSISNPKRRRIGQNVEGR